MSERVASSRTLYGVAWALCAALLLGAGFVVFVALGAAIALARAGTSAATGVMNAFGIYGLIVLLKGLLPALAVAFLLWALFDWALRLRDRGRIAVALGVLVAAALGSVAVAGLLLNKPTGPIGSVHYTGAENFLRTCAEMAAPVALSLWITRALLPTSRRAVALVLAGIAVVFAAGGASIARYVHHAPPPAAPSSAAQPAPEAAGPFSSAGEAVAVESIPRIEADPGAIDTQQRDAAEPPQLGWEETLRRQKMAERLRALIDKGPDAKGAVADGGLLAEGKPEPVYRDGELAGIALRNVPPDSFYAGLGLREGDVVSSINGVHFDAPDAPGALLDSLVSNQQLEIEVERSDGTLQQLAVPFDRVIEGLRALE